MDKETRSISDGKSNGKEIKVMCQECVGEKYHLVLQAVNIHTEWSDKEFTIDGATEYQIIECQGCKAVSFRSESWFSEDFDSTGGYELTTTLFPKRSVDTLHIKKFHNVPRILRRIYREVIDAYNEELVTLCAGGLRALLEGICAEKNIKKGLVPQTDGTNKTKKNFEGKIFGLAENGILTVTNADILHQHRFLGNKALHQLAQPALSDLRLAIEIIEHVLDSIFELPEKARQLGSMK